MAAAPTHCHSTGMFWLSPLRQVRIQPGLPATIYRLAWPEGRVLHASQPSTRISVVFPVLVSV